MKKFTVIFLFFVTILSAQYDRPGSTDGQFLKIGVSPRGEAMGGAYISLVKGAEAAYYNPAALSEMKGTDIFLSHTRWFAGINHNYISIAKNFGDIGSFALSATALRTDEMIVTTPLQPSGNGETFYSSNYRFGLTYSRYFNDHVTIGLTVSYLYFSLYKDFTASSFSVDIAAKYKADFRDFGFAMQISHFGSDVSYVNESYPLPTNFIFGANMNAVEFDTSKLIVAVQANKPNEGPPKIVGGMEWNYNDKFFVRGGYQFSHSTARYSFGAGMQYSLSGYDMNLDYSYNDYNLLNVVHRFAIGIHF